MIVNDTRETVLITGASSGIGRELAELFASDGSDLVLVARRKNLLDQLADKLSSRYGVRAVVMPTDLGAAGAVQEMAHRLSSMSLRIDVLVNSAGFGARGSFTTLPSERLMEMVEVNIAAVTHLTRLFLPSMVQRKRGGVINLGSVAGFLPGPNMATYYASKAYILAFSEALQEEVRGTGVTVCCVAPGPTDTEFVQQAGLEGVRFFRLGAMDATTVARSGYRGFRSGRALVVPGVSNKAATFLLRFSPRLLTRRLSGWLNV
ncbi:SDR family oxidoreductase [soil metagenome]